jgi:Zn finger protein HypA/HybF involved in hydrogenase expression
MSLLGDILSSVAKGAVNGVLKSVAEATGNVSITWYCDNCNAVMNEQEGFTTEHGYWDCTNCGTTNDVTDGNVYNSEREYEPHRHEPRCPYCGRILSAEDGEYYSCSGPYCMNETFRMDDGELVDLYPAELGGKKMPQLMHGNQQSKYQDGSKDKDRFHQK